MYEIRVLFESEALGDSISYPLSHPDPCPGEAYERKGYAIYKYQEDGSQQCTEIIEQDLATAAVKMHDLMWPIVEKMLQNNYNKNKKPKENGTKETRQAALGILKRLEENLNKHNEMAGALHTQPNSELWMIQNYCIQAELDQRAIDTLTKWIEENYYPI